jgi:hypothetical protein
MRKSAQVFGSFADAQFCFHGSFSSVFSCDAEMQRMPKRRSVTLSSARSAKTASTPG